VPSVLWHRWLGVRKSIRPVKNWVMRCWCGYLSGARCRLFAYGPADATASQDSKSRLALPFWYRLTQAVVEKRPLNGCSNCCWILTDCERECVQQLPATVLLLTFFYLIFALLNAGFIFESRLVLIANEWFTDLSVPLPLSPDRQHLSYGGYLEAKGEYYQNCSVMRCVYDSCAQRYAHRYEQFLNLCLFGLD